MDSTPLAVIADVHGNGWALEAVLTDIARRGVRSIVNLGDNANGPVDPARCIDLLWASGARHVRGNGDRMTGEGGENVRGSAAFARERLSADALRWLSELPTIVRGEDWIAMHATPRSDEEYLLEDVVAGKTVLASPEEIARRLGATEASLVLSGHTHLPRLMRLPDGRLVVNPGSVGLPAYRDEQPTPHVVEAGSPHARYAILHRGNGDWCAEFICLAYDWALAARAARSAGWESWASQIETGFAAAPTFPATRPKSV
jgi:predicted phosphodiesterase